MSLTYKLLNVGILIFILIPCIRTDVASFVTSYTKLEGNRQEFWSETKVNQWILISNNSKMRNLTYKQELKEVMSKEGWGNVLHNLEKMQQISEKNINIMRDNINTNKDMLTFQRTYGCTWNENNGEVQAFDMYGFNGEDFISLDMEEKKYVAFSAQALQTKKKWNEDQNQLDFLINYYKKDCIFWLKEILNSDKKETLDLKRKVVSPEVSLLQKDPTAPVVCHVTGFYPPINITWELKSSYCQKPKEKIQVGEIMPNENGTFQQSVTLNVSPEDQERCVYYCKVTDNDGLWKVVNNRDHVKSNYESVMTIVIIVILSVVALMAVVGIFFAVTKRCNRSTPDNSGSSKSLVDNKIV